MPELTQLTDPPDLPDLAGDVRARAVPPPYDEVGRRVRARRRRVVAGVLATTVLVVGGVGVAQSLVAHQGSAPPRPAEHGPLPMTDPALWRAVVEGPAAHAFAISGTADGAVAVVWRALEPGAPTFALVIREADGTVHGLRLEEPVLLTPAPGGWVGVQDLKGWFIGSDGSWTSLGDAGPARGARPGDVFVAGQYATWLYAPGDQTWSVLANPYLEAADGYVTPAGDLVTCGVTTPGHVQLFVSDQPRGPEIRGATCVLAGRGAAVAMAGLGDAPGGDVPLTGLLLPTDHGLAVPGVAYPPLNGVTSLVVTPQGSTVVTGVEGRSFVIRRDGTTLVEPTIALGVVLSAGDRLYALQYGCGDCRPAVSDDNGATWQQSTLPGMESSGR